MHHDLNANSFDGARNNSALLLRHQLEPLRGPDETDGMDDTRQRPRMAPTPTSAYAYVHELDGQGHHHSARIPLN